MQTEEERMAEFLARKRGAVSANPLGGNAQPDAEMARLKAYMAERRGPQPTPASTFGGVAADVGEYALGVGELALEAGTGMASMAAGGLAGASLEALKNIPGSDYVMRKLSYDKGEPPTGEEVLNYLQDTMTYNPRTESAEMIKKDLSSIAEYTGIADLSEYAAEEMEGYREAMGDKIFEMTGSPALSSLAYIGPDIMVQGATGGLASRLASRGSRPARQPFTDKGKKDELNKNYMETELELEKLKGVQQELYDEIANSDVKLKRGDKKDLARRLRTRIATDKKSPDPEYVDAGQGLMKKIDLLAQDKFLGGNRMVEKVSDIENLRDWVNSNMTEGKQKALRGVVNREIDEYMVDNPSIPDDVKTRYRATKEMDKRVFKGGKMDEFFTESTANGKLDQNKLAAKFRGFADSVDAKKFYTGAERQAMRDVGAGDTGAISNFLSKRGFSDQFVARSLTSGGLGVIFPVAGNAIASYAKSKIRNSVQTKANVTRAMFKAGKDGEAIIKTYLRNTPRNMRDPEVLSEYLAQPGVKLSDIEDRQSALFKSALEKTKVKRALYPLIGISPFIPQDSIEEEDNE